MVAVNSLGYDERTMPKRYVADTPLARFLIEQFGPDLNISEIERQSTARGVKLLASNLSRYLNGDEGISPEIVRRLAVFTGRPEGEIRALLPGSARSACAPDSATRALIQEAAREGARAVLAELGLDAAGLELIRVLREQFPPDEARVRIAEVVDHYQRARRAPKP